MKGRSDFEGCLLGGAIGDAIAAPIEFSHYSGILDEHGPDGIRGFVNWHFNGFDSRGCFTDDTQMTLFSADGLIRAWRHAEETGEAKGYRRLTYRSYLRWYATQFMEFDAAVLQENAEVGWLMKIEGLHRRMAPGMTCMDALGSGRRGGVESDRRLNDSKGCGTVMRVAPAGLLNGGPLMNAWDLGCDLGSITHGHETGIQSGGAFAVMIDAVVDGADLVAAVHEALKYVTDRATESAIREAMRASETGAADARTVESLGGGWVAEEALGIALFCALKHPFDFREAVLLAANHSGDSDSTAAICGNIVGLLVGSSGIPQEWRDDVQMGEVICTVARDLYSLRAGNSRHVDLDVRYPFI
ncbi:ADP-ribosylglycohydrolase family protein [Flavobacteriales bacterium]|nr:ADP-ribosylglycohydrolase family protein [Flavobacteriales bacterium]